MIINNENVINEKGELIEINEDLLQEKIYEFRNKKVMLDSDLAEIYGYETKNFNRQVKNNALKFEGDDFMFELSDEETRMLSRCKKCTLNQNEKRGANVKYNPHVFTEQGDIYVNDRIARRTCY